MGWDVCSSAGGWGRFRKALGVLQGPKMQRFFCLRNGIMPQRSLCTPSTPNCLVFHRWKQLDSRNAIHHPSVKATAKFLEGQCPFYGHGASWSVISTMQSYCPSRPLGGWWNVAPGWSWGVLLQLRPVMDVTQMWRLICVKNSWDAWGIINIFSRTFPPPICRHLFACLSKPQSYPLWKSKAVRVHWTPLPWAAFLLWLISDSELMVFEKNRWWMIKDSDVILTWFKNLCITESSYIDVLIIIDER